MSEPQFSIVIPTRNRRFTLESCLRTCMDQVDAPAFEIVISDNSDGSETRDFVRNLLSRDARVAARVSYRHHDRVTGMTENFERAISYARGDYVIVLGDDDGMLPMALMEIQRLISSTGAKVIKWSSGLYTWPDLALDDSSNYLGFSLERSVTRRNGLEELGKSLETLSYINLPMLYINAAVHRSVIEDIRLGDGRVFNSRSPDVYSGVAIAYHCGEFLDVSAPFSLAGLSRSSNGVSSAFSGANAAPKKDFDSINARTGFKPHRHVPDLPIYPLTALAESFLYAKEDHFPHDNRFELTRERILSECVQRSDVSSARVRELIYATCSDEPDRIAYVDALLAEGRPPIANPRLKPVNLGPDGVNLHLEASDFGVRTIEDAVRLTSKFIWPGGAPLDFD